MFTCFTMVFIQWFGPRETMKAASPLKLSSPTMSIFIKPMSWITFFILVAIGMASGFLGGMIGLGGGIILIPAMVMFLAMDQRMAQGTSLAIMLPPIGLLA